MYLLLFCFWLLLNGRITIEILLIGLAVTAAMAVLENALFGYTPKAELAVLRRAPLFCAYIPVLVWEILKAAAAVSGDILLRRHELTPAIVTFRTGLKTELGRYLLANSITLTPGTITVKLEEDCLTVHCLDRSLLDISEDGVFQRWIRRMEE